jgi:hypothetical protein
MRGLNTEAPTNWVWVLSQGKVSSEWIILVPRCVCGCEGVILSTFIFY